MYLSYIQLNFNPTEEEMKLLESQECQDLFEKIQKKGGFLRYQSFEEVDPKFLPVFQKYILNFEEQSVNLDGTYLHKTDRLEFDKKLNCWLQPINYWFDQQLLVWNLPECILQNINQGFFTFQSIGKNHGNQLVDIREQKSGVNSFHPDPNTNLISKSLKISDYVSYSLDKERYMQQNPNYNKNSILFAVNIDMDGWVNELAHLQEYLPPSLYQEDGLFYLRQQILGVNVPQLYMKVKGCWTGGHQENGAVNSVNFNHGPSECIWITVDAQYVPDLLKLQPDLIKNEGLWFKEVDYFLSNKIPVKYTVQKPGDLVLIGAGCLHWVKSCGNTINSSWNFLCCSDNSFDQLILRQTLNENHQIRMIIPIKNLLLDLYIHNGYVKLQQVLVQYLEEEMKILNKCKNQIRSIKINPQGKLILSCCNCEQEIFVIYQRIGQQYLCMKCLNGEKYQIEFKYNPVHLNSLMQCNQQNCSPLLCSIYMGDTNCKLNLQEPEVNEQRIKKVLKRQKQMKPIVSKPVVSTRLAQKKSILKKVIQVDEESKMNSKIEQISVKQLLSDDEDLKEDIINNIKILRKGEKETNCEI